MFTMRPFIAFLLLIVVLPFLSYASSSSDSSASSSSASSSSDSSASDSSSSDSSSDDFTPFTLERFEQFKAELLVLFNCNDTLGGNNPCQGLTQEHPDVSVYDSINLPIQSPIVPNLLRLAFHDCAGVDPYYISLGDTESFRDSETNGFAGGCNGCIGIDNPENDNLLEGSIEIIEPICDDYSDVISRADCWSLAATLAVEFAAANPYEGGLVKSSKRFCMLKA